MPVSRWRRPWEASPRPPGAPAPLPHLLQVVEDRIQSTLEELLGGPTGDAVEDPYPGPRAQKTPQGEAFVKGGHEEVLAAGLTQCRDGPPGTQAVGVGLDHAGAPGRCRHPAQAEVVLP